MEATAHEPTTRRQRGVIMTRLIQDATAMGTCIAESERQDNEDPEANGNKRAKR